MIQLVYCDGFGGDSNSRSYFFATAANLFRSGGPEGGGENEDGSSIGTPNSLKKFSNPGGVIIDSSLP